MQHVGERRKTNIKLWSKSMNGWHHMNTLHTQHVIIKKCENLLTELTSLLLAD
jgi:hypothetical protein